jgi:Icc-related predicted phosphoesterase
MPGSPLMSRLFFCTDLHGSEVCFRKFLHAGRVYEADVVIMGGDCTGKMVIPIVGNGTGTFECNWLGEMRVLHSEDEVAEQEKQITNNGLYPVRLSSAELEEVQGDQAHLDALFQKLMLERLAAWMELAEERLRDSGLEVIVTPGNDDDFAVDDVIASSSFVNAAEGKVVRVAGHYEMLSVGWSNPTPWDTPRECSEEELAGKIAALAEQIEDMDNAIFNIHVPPYGTGLDAAPELEHGTRLKRGGSIMKPVGSTAVRDAILEYQPVLSLHGHIHESRNMQRLGRTVSINPGSAYSDWTLQGVLVDLEDGKVSRYVPVTG